MHPVNWPQRNVIDIRLGSQGLLRLVCVMDDTHEDYQYSTSEGFSYLLAYLTTTYSKEISEKVLQQRLSIFSSILIGEV